MTENHERQGLTVTHRRYVSYAEAHYAGNLVAGGYLMGLFGDVATEVCIRTDGDEGLLAGYREVNFSGAVRGGDVVEVTATVTRVGNRSRDLDLRAVVTCRSTARSGDGTDSGSEVLAEPLQVASAL